MDSIIQQPLDKAILNSGNHSVEGIAWTGTGIIREVEVSIDGGESWNKAELTQDLTQPYSWTVWKYIWKASEKGEYTIMSRARDSIGRSQPFVEVWNRKGYGYNAVYTIMVKVE